jgi:hypothetical protein
MNKAKKTPTTRMTKKADWAHIQRIIAKAAADTGGGSGNGMIPSGLGAGKGLLSGMGKKPPQAPSKPAVAPQKPAIEPIPANVPPPPYVPPPASGLPPAQPMTVKRAEGADLSKGLGGGTATPAPLVSAPKLPTAPAVTPPQASKINISPNANDLLAGAGTVQQPPPPPATTQIDPQEQRYIRLFGKAKGQEVYRRRRETQGLAAQLPPGQPGQSVTGTFRQNTLDPASVTTSPTPATQPQAPNPYEGGTWQSLPDGSHTFRPPGKTTTTHGPNGSYTERWTADTSALDPELAQAAAKPTAAAPGTVGEQSGQISGHPAGSPSAQEQAGQPVTPPTEPVKQPVTPQSPAVHNTDVPAADAPGSVVFDDEVIKPLADTSIPVEQRQEQAKELVGKGLTDDQKTRVSTAVANPDSEESQQLVAAGKDKVMQQSVDEAVAKNPGAGPQSVGEFVQQKVQQFQQMPFESQLLIGIGLPVGLIGILSSLFGEGGATGGILGALGLGAAGLAATNSGMFGNDARAGLGSMAYQAANFFGAAPDASAFTPEGMAKGREAATAKVQSAMTGAFAKGEDVRGAGLAAFNDAKKELDTLATMGPEIGTTMLMGALDTKDPAAARAKYDELMKMHASLSEPGAFDRELAKTTAGRGFQMAERAGNALSSAGNAIGNFFGGGAKPQPQAQ